MYQNGKIYKITDNGYNLCYYGSTVQTLSNRLSGHKRHYTRYQAGNHHTISVFKLFDDYGVENCKIELVELFPCNSKIELLQREGHHIKNNDCVNRIVSGRTKEEYYIDNKERILERVKDNQQRNTDRTKERQKVYRETHKDEQQARNKKYWQEHREELREKRNQYLLDHKEELKEHRKEYYANNKDKIIEYKKTKYSCDACNASFRVGDRAKHERTKRHVKNMQNLEIHEQLEI